MPDDEWKKELEQFDERTRKRRAKAKEEDEKAQDMIARPMNGARPRSQMTRMRGRRSSPPRRRLLHLTGGLSVNGRRITASARSARGPATGSRLRPPRTVHPMAGCYDKMGRESTVPVSRVRSALLLLRAAVCRLVPVPCPTSATGCYEGIGAGNGCVEPRHSPSSRRRKEAISTPTPGLGDGSEAFANCLMWRRPAAGKAQRRFSGTTFTRTSRRCSLSY